MTVADAIKELSKLSPAAKMTPEAVAALETLKAEITKEEKARARWKRMWEEA